MTDAMMRGFLNACGSSGPLILGVDEPNTSATSWRILDHPYAVVGRDPACDLVLHHEDVSRRHAYLQRIAGRLFCVDLESRTGTLWDGETGLWGWIDPGPGVGIGPFHVRSRDEGSIPQATGSCPANLPVPVSRTFEQPELPDVTLEFLSRSRESTSWRATRALILVGSSRSCKIRLEGSGIAEVHASLVRTSAGLYVIDLLAPSGIQVNGEPVRSALLVDGDELKLGSYRIRIHEGQKTTIRGSMARRAQRKTLDRDGDPPSFPPPEETEGLIRGMMEEFGRIQDRTIDRLQTSMVHALQSMATMHRDELDLIRSELASIRQLTEEQQSLRHQIEAKALAPASPPTLRLVQDSTPAPGQPGAKPAHPAPSLTLKTGTAAEATWVAPTCSGPRAAAGTTPTEAPQEVDLHAQILDRLEQIQGERIGRWQKLRDTLVGKRS